MDQAQAAVSRGIEDGKDLIAGDREYKVDSQLPQRSRDCLSSRSAFHHEQGLWRYRKARSTCLDKAVPN
jgi:hypothetical protein